MRMRASVLIGLSVALVISPAVAQSGATTASQEDGQPVVQQRQAPLDTDPSGRTARSSVGQVGQRQTRDTAEQQTGIKPMARITSRVQNRVQNRVRNRIDPYYDPQANATDPFVVAGDQVRTSGRPR